MLSLHERYVLVKYRSFSAKSFGQTRYVDTRKLALSREGDALIRKLAVRVKICSGVSISGTIHDNSPEGSPKLVTLVTSLGKVG